jgi:hypothetical protein
LVVGENEEDVGAIGGVGRSDAEVDCHYGEQKAHW